MILGGNRLAGSAKDSFANALGAVGCASGFHNLVDFLADFTNVEDDVQFLVVAFDVEAEFVAGFLRTDPTLRPARGIGVIPMENFVSYAQSSLSGIAVRLKAPNDHWAIGFAFQEESQDRASALITVKFETAKGENGSVWKRFGTSDIFVEELLQ